MTMNRRTPWNLISFKLNIIIRTTNTIIKKIVFKKMMKMYNSKKKRTISFSQINQKLLYENVYRTFHYKYLAPWKNTFSKLNV